MDIGNQIIGQSCMITQLFPPARIKVHKEQAQQIEVYINNTFSILWLASYFRNAICYENCKLEQHTSSLIRQFTYLYRIVQFCNTVEAEDETFLNNCYVQSLFSQCASATIIPFCAFCKRVLCHLIIYFKLRNSAFVCSPRVVQKKVFCCTVCGSGGLVQFLVCEK